MKKQFHDRYPEMILEIVNKKYHTELTYVKDVEKQIADRDLEIKQYIRLRYEMEQKKFALTKENERLEKMVQKQNQVLRSLQDRLDSVNNSGQ
jgi:lysyl-tRNA synthetase class I